MAKRFAGLLGTLLITLLLALSTSACGGGSDADPDGGVDLGVDAANGNGSNGNGNGSNGNGSGGSWEDPDCPTYHVRCDGECIPAVSDPDNCGGCGITCEEGEFCSGGSCVSETDFSCPDFEDADIEVCGRRCVDTNWDNENCGSCGRACPEGQGCVFGNCVEPLGTSDEIAGCEDGGPPIFFPPGEENGNGDGDADLCAGHVAETVFRFGLCSCNDIDLGQRIFVDGFVSSDGGYVPGARGGSVGANANISTHTADETLTVTSVLWSSGDQITLRHNSTIGEELYCAGDLDTRQTVTVGQHGFITGDINSTGSLEFGGTLHVSEETSFNENTVSFDELIRDGDLEVREACTECAPEDRLPIADLVAARADANDNDLIDLSSDALVGVTSDTRLDLPCGNYYLDGISASSGSNITIVAHGRTALYIDGDVQTNSRIIIVPAEGAELDVLVAGDVSFAQLFTQIGSPNYPAMFRMYVGGEGGVTVNHRIGLGGFLYAVPGGYNQPSQRVRVFGGIYTENYVTGNQDTDITFDRRVLTIGEGCPDGSDRCVPLEGECETSADCCTPFQCFGGICSEGVIID